MNTFNNDSFASALQEYKLGNIDNVELILNNILEKDSDCIEAIKLAATLAHTNRNYAKAIKLYKIAIEKDPNNVAIYCQLAKLYEQKNQFEKAVDLYQEALILKPEKFKINQYLAYAFIKLKKTKSAIIIYNRLLEIEPENVVIKWNRALVYLKNGNYEKGLPEFECRKYIPSFSNSYLPNKLMWDGSDLNGKKILIYQGDDGFGDTIQFIRYVSLIKSKNAKVVFAASKPLLRLFNCILDIEELIPLETNLTSFDIYIPLLSLPYCFETNIKTIPSCFPYINISKLQQTLQTKLPCLPKVEEENEFKIGIVWSSGHRDRHDTIKPCYRDCPLSLFIDLLSISNDISLYSLQVGTWAREIDEFKHKDRLYDLTSQIRDFADTAAFISQLDLVISVDTAVAHLAGAMGMPVWTLLAYDSDWRWLIDREDSPWYPSMRLFRQSEWGNWSDVFVRVKQTLNSYLNNKDKQEKHNFVLNTNEIS